MISHKKKLLCKNSLNSIPSLSLHFPVVPTKGIESCPSIIIIYLFCQFFLKYATCSVHIFTSINSFCNLSHDRSIASSIAQTSAYSINFQYPFFPFTSSISCLLFLPRLPVTSLYLSFDGTFYKAVPMQDVTNPIIPPSFYCMYHIPPLLECL